MSTRAHEIKTTLVMGTYQVSVRESSCCNLKCYEDGDNAMQLLLGAHNMLKKTSNAILHQSVLCWLYLPKREPNIYTTSDTRILSPTMINIKCFCIFMETNIQIILLLKLK